MADVPKFQMDELFGGEEPEFRVGLQAYRDFFDGDVWRDLKDYYEGRIIQNEVLLQDPSTGTENILRLQGAMTELKILLGYEESTISALEYEAGLKTEKEEVSERSKG